MDSLQTTMWKRYRNAWPPEVQPGDQLISRIFREVSARLLSVREVWKVKCLADQLRSSRRSIPLASGADIRLPEEQSEEHAAQTYDAYMALLWTLLLACAIVGARPRDPAPGNRPETEESVADSILFVECPLDVLEAYFRRAELNARKVPFRLRLEWISRRDLAERTKWVDRFRNSKLSLGEVVKTVFTEREACWEPPSSEQGGPSKRRSRSRSRGGARSATSPGGASGARLSAAGAGKGKIFFCEKFKGKKLCTQWNLGPCPEPCRDGNLHACDAKQSHGGACGGKHKRCACPTPLRSS